MVIFDEPAPPDEVLARIVDGASVGVAVCNVDGSFRKVNPAYARVCGRPAEELVGASPHELGLAFPADGHDELVARVAATGLAILDVETVVPGVSGAAPTVWVSGFHPLFDGRRVDAVGIVSVDATASRGAEQALREREETLRLTLDETETGVWSWTVGADEIEWSSKVSVVHGLAEGESTPKRFEDYIGLVHPEDRALLTGVVGQAVERGEGYELDFRVVPPGGSVRWVWTRATLLDGGADRPPRLVGITRDATHRVRLQEHERFFRDAAEVLMSSRDERQMLGELARLAVGTVCDWCSFELVRGGTFEQVAVAHQDPEKVGLARELRRRMPPEPDAPSGAGKVARTGEPELYERITEDTLASMVEDEELLRIVLDLGLHSAMIVPLVVHDATIGAATFVTAESGRAYGAADLEFALDVSRSIALAVENARLFASERAARAAVEAAHGRTARLQRVTESLSTTLTPDEVVGVMLMDGCEAVGAARCRMYLLDGERLLPCGDGGEGTAADRDAVAVDIGSQHPAAEALRKLRPVVAAAPSVRNPDVDRSASAGRNRVGLGLPLLSRSEPVGAAVLTYPDGVVPTQADKTLAMTVGRLCAEALERARIFEREHDVAVTLQRSMLPHSLPDVSGLRIAAKYLPGVEGLHVGGDWFDAVALDGGALAVTVGDVVGKGIFAAAAMGQLRNAVRVYALEGYPPGDLVARLSERADELSNASFATLVHVVVDPDSGRCRYAAAGHPPPLLRRADGEVIRLEGGRTPPLGAGPYPAEEGSVELRAGDSLILYTDGLAERRSLPLVEGLDRLEAALASGPPEGAGRLADHLLRALDAEGREDDLVVFVLQLDADQAPASARSADG